MGAERNRMNWPIGDGCLLQTDSGEKIARSCFGTKPVERKVFETDRGLRGTGIEISFRFTGGESTPGEIFIVISRAEIAVGSLYYI